MGRVLCEAALLMWRDREFAMAMGYERDNILLPVVVKIEQNGMCK